jgi:hypothetical protein
MKFRNILFVLALAGLTSCEDDFLDKVPMDSPSSATFFSTETELNMAVNGAYRQLYWHSYKVPYQLWLDASTDIAWCRGDFGSMLTAQGGQYTTETPLFSTVWAHMYEGIARTNNILDNMDRAKDVVPAEKAQAVEAEAKFLRSYFYTYLINLYGDVPWVDRMLSLEDAKLPKTPKKEILANLYKDLDFAAAHLPAARPTAEKGKVTKGAALTLKARVALLAGDFDVAASAARAVMDLGLYKIDPSYSNLFQYKGAGSAEVIMEQQYHMDVFTTAIPRYLAHREPGGYSVLVPTQTLVDMYACTDGKPIDESPLFDPAKPFENRDPRLDQSILLPGEWVKGLQFQTHPDSTKTYKRTDAGIRRVANPEVTNAYATFTGYIWNKYLDESDLPGNLAQSTLRMVMMRYAEVLLTYAEAKIELNQIDQSVIDAINLVRCRQSVQMPPAEQGMSQPELRKLVRYERTIELALEGFRLFDIRRWKYAEHVMPGNMLGRRKKAEWFSPVVPDIDEYGHPVYPDETKTFQVISVNQFNPGRDYLWPIPQSEINLNPNLTQNPGYN